MLRICSDLGLISLMHEPLKSTGAFAWTAGQTGLDSSNNITFLLLEMGFFSVSMRTNFRKSATAYT